MSTKQNTAAGPKCRKMAEEYKDIEFVLNDESYFKKANSIQTLWKKHHMLKTLTTMIKC